MASPRQFVDYFSYQLRLMDDKNLSLGNDDDAEFHWNGTQLVCAPASGFWAGCPSIAYPDLEVAYFYVEDFIGHVTLPVATGAAGGWKATGDATYDVKAAAGSVGGQLQLTPETGSNNEVYFQLGELGTETFVEYVKNSGKKSWVEFRVAFTSITNAANILVGLAEEGAAAADFIADAGDDIADKDAVGFVIWEGDPNALDCIHQKAGGAFADPGLALVPVAGTFYTLGIYFDGVETVSFYVDDAVVQTADLDTATFPTDEELSPILAIKNGAADGTLEIDWIKMVVERS